jgi:hypothetical protein
MLQETLLVLRCEVQQTGQLQTGGTCISLYELLSSSAAQQVLRLN